MTNGIKHQRIRKLFFELSGLVSRWGEETLEQLEEVAVVGVAPPGGEGYELGELEASDL